MWKWKLLTLLSILTLVITTSFWPDAPGETDGDPWALLQTIEYKEEMTETTWRVEKIFPPELRAAAEDFSVWGYIVPIVAEGEMQTFLLVEQPEDCPFCFGGYGPTLEVHLKRPMRSVDEFSPIALTGQLEFNESTETLQSVRLVDAIPSEYVPDRPASTIPAVPSHILMD